MDSARNDGGTMSGGIGNGEVVDAGDMACVRAAFGKDRYQIHGVAVLCGRDLNLVFTGGTMPHIGAASLAVCEWSRHSATASTICVHMHRDDYLSADCARETAARFQCTAAVTVGIHIDDASPQEIRRLCGNFKECRNRLWKEIEKRRDVRGNAEF